MFRLVRPTFALTVATTLVVLLRVRNVAGAGDAWSWTITPAMKNAGTCDIASCKSLYGQTNSTTDALSACFTGSQSTCVFTAVGDPGVATLPVICPGSKSKVASLDISALVPPFGDSIYSNGSAWVDFKNKPDVSMQCDFYSYVGKWKAPAQTCLDDVDDTYWVPDTTNGVITSMTKRFELSLYKVIEGGVTGYYIENANWTKCGNSIDSVSLNSGFKVVVSMAGNIGKPAVVTTTPAPKSTTSTTTKGPGPGQTRPIGATGTGALDWSEYTGTGATEEGVDDVIRVSLGLVVAMMAIVITVQL